MPRVAKKPAPAQAEEQTESILDFLSKSAPGAQTSAPAAHEPKATDISVADLQTEIARLNDRIASQERMNTTLLTTPPQVQQTPNAPEMLPLDLAGLPDPWADGPAYTKAFNERIAANVLANHKRMQDYEAQVRGAQQNGDQRLNQLWDDFVSQHPEFEGQEDRIEFAASKVVSAAHARGIDVNRYMLGTTPRFFEDVVSTYRKVFGEDEGDGTEEEPTPQAKAKSANRTGGIPGGLESGGSASAAGEDGPKTTFTQDLKEIQRASGLF